MKRQRTPGIVDIAIIDRPDEVRAAAADPVLDRDFHVRGPLLNRLWIGETLSTLRVDGHRFPTMLPRGDVARAEARDGLLERLASVAPGIAQGPPELEDLAAYVRGAGAPEDAGPLVQQQVGLLFSDRYRATGETWAAALTLHRAVASTRLREHLWWGLTGAVRRARDVLAEQVGGDLAAVNATGVAVHHIVHGVARMRDLHVDPAGRGTSAEAMALRCQFAPTVTRQEVGGSRLVRLDLQAALDASGDTGLAYLRGTWAVCPGEAWVPALLSGVWRRAISASAEPAS